MSTEPSTPTPRFVELEAAQTLYEVLAADDTWTPSKTRAEMAAAEELVRLYRALSHELTGALAVAVRHAGKYFDDRVAELENRLGEDFTEAEYKR